MVDCQYFAATILSRITLHLEANPQIPLDHPLRAIARAFHEASDGTLLRVTIFKLTDSVETILFLFLLIRYGKNHPIRLLLSDNADNKRALDEFSTKFGALFDEVISIGVDNKHREMSYTIRFLDSASRATFPRRQTIHLKAFPVGRLWWCFALVAWVFLLFWSNERVGGEIRTVAS